MHDFSLYSIRPIAIRYIGGLGKIHWIDMGNYAVKQAGAFAGREEFLLDQINSFRQDVLQRMVPLRKGIDAAVIQAYGFDCDGIDNMRINVKVTRLNFPEILAEPSLDALHSLKTGS